MISLRNISKQLGNFNLENINLEIEDNEYFVILGPTGTGKTVILELISGMYKPDEGEIWINGCNVTSEYPETRQIGFVYQDYMLFPHLSVEDNITFALELKKIPKGIIRERLEEMTSLFKIGALLDRYPSTLSGGEQQRVALARALVADPKVLLLDEPLSALDPRSKELFQLELKSVHEKTRTTTIHITHDFSEALVLADRMAVMIDGKIAQAGYPDELFRKPQSQLVAEFVGMDNIYSGEMINEDNNQYVRIGSVKIRVVSELKGKVRIGIHPEDIIIARERFLSSAQNTFNARIIKIIPRGPFVKIILDIGMTLTALVTRKAWHEMELEVGQNVWVVFKAAAVCVF